MTRTQLGPWRKSSHSAGGQGGCVELSWRKSSYSAGGQGDCVELAREDAVRDSKNPAGPVLMVPLRAFVLAARQDLLAR